MASVDDQEKQSSKSWLRHALESALIALDRPAGFLVPVGAAVVCIRAVCSFLNALLVYQTEHAILGDWAGKAFILNSSTCYRSSPYHQPCHSCGAAHGSAFHSTSNCCATLSFAVHYNL